MHGSANIWNNYLFYFSQVKFLTAWGNVWTQLLKDVIRSKCYFTLPAGQYPNKLFIQNQCPVS